MINKFLEFCTNSYRIKVDGILVIVSKTPSKVVKISNLKSRSYNQIARIMQYLIEEKFIIPDSPCPMYEIVNCKF